MQNLRTLRRSRALTFLDLAALTGIPARQLAEIEYGLRNLGAHEREALAVALGLHPGGFTGAHRRPAARALAITPPPLAEQRALQTLLVAALAATLATGAVLGGVPELPAPGFTPRAALERAPVLVAEPGTAGALGEVTIDLGAGVAATPARLAQAILAIRAALPEVALSPELLVAPTPPESVAPPPLPVIETAPPFVMTDAGPLGCPVKPDTGHVVMTQGYAVGSHAPAETWGAVDLAVDGNGDGYAESGATWYAPVVATHDGTITVNLDSWPAGNHVWVSDPSGVWRSGYAHLAMVTVTSGQFVRAGEQIGMIGSTGQSSGPHLHYHLWKSGVNIDPTGLVGC